MANRDKQRALAVLVVVLLAVVGAVGWLVGWRLIAGGVMLMYLAVRFLLPRVEPRPDATLAARSARTFLHDHWAAHKV